MNLGILTNLWPEYLNESAALHAEGHHHWWNHFYEHGEDNYQLDPELKAKLDELSSKVVRATGIVSEEVHLQQTNASEVGHFQLTVECIIDERSTLREPEDEDYCTSLRNSRTRRSSILLLFTDKAPCWDRQCSRGLRKLKILAIREESSILDAQVFGVASFYWVVGTSSPDC